MHPYMHVLYKRRRTRYYKLERGLKGFFVPDYLRKEAKDRLFSDFAKNRADWYSYRNREWFNDTTPTMHWSHTEKLFPLELFVLHGLFRDWFWDRFFYNETKPEITDAEAL